MKGFNKVTLIGNLGQDAKVSEHGGDTTIANMRLAVTERRKKNGAYEEQTQWFNVTAFGRLGDIAMEYGKKGVGLFVEGRIEVKEPEPGKRYVDIIANELVFTSTKKKEGETEGEGGLPF